MKFLLLIALLLLTIGAGKVARKSGMQQRSAPPPSNQTPPPARSRWYRRVAFAATWMLGLATLAEAPVTLFGGPPWWTSPEIEPSKYDAVSAFYIPFLVSNPSILFPLTDTHFACLLNFIEFENGGTVDHSLSETGVLVTIAPGAKDVPFRCTFLELLGLGNRKVVQASFGILVGYTIRLPFWQMHFMKYFGPFVWDTTLRPPAWRKENMLR